MGKRKSVHTKPTESTDDQCPIWIFQYIDREGKFAFDTSRKDFQLDCVKQETYIGTSRFRVECFLS